MEGGGIPVIKGNESQRGDAPESLITYTTRIAFFSSHTGNGSPRHLEGTRLGKVGQATGSTPSPDSTPTELETRFHLSGLRDGFGNGPASSTKGPCPGQSQHFWNEELAGGPLNGSRIRMRG